VYVVTDGRASARGVQTGIADATSIEVVTGLTAGDRVVVVGQNGLRDGQAVAVAPSAPRT
jgi:multidrug efflux pump subunit AcrA (membrane-fusion protein)